MENCVQEVPFILESVFHIDSSKCLYCMYKAPMYKSGHLAMLHNFDRKIIYYQNLVASYV